MAQMLPSPFAADFLLRALAGGALVAVICAIVGTWVVVRGMAFLGEAIGHGVLPGVAVATLLGVPVLWGAAVSAAAMSTTIGLLQRRGRLSYDTSIGLLFVGMLSAGVIIVSHSRSFATDATTMLFGDILAIGGLRHPHPRAALAVVLVTATVFHRSFVAAAFDTRIAHTLGLRPRLAQIAAHGPRHDCRHRLLPERSARSSSSECSSPRRSPPGAGRDRSPRRWSSRAPSASPPS